MSKLNQIIAIEKDVKNKFARQETDLHRTVQIETLLNGITRTYSPRDENGETRPTEATLVQVRVEDVLKQLAKAAERVFDVTLTKEAANAEAKADIVVDGALLLENVPVTYLLFLEKQLVNLNTFVAKLPTLSPAVTWSKDENTGTYVTEPTQKVSTKKIPQSFEKSPATDRHAAQVEMYYEDKIVGDWTTVLSSGAIPQVRKSELLDRLDKLSAAVKFAREEANNTVVTDRQAAGAVFTYLLG
jgi:hypothetical protein